MMGLPSHELSLVGLVTRKLTLFAPVLSDASGNSTWDVWCSQPGPFGLDSHGTVVQALPFSDTWRLPGLKLREVSKTRYAPRGLLASATFAVWLFGARAR